MAIKDAVTPVPPLGVNVRTQLVLVPDVVLKVVVSAVYSADGKLPPCKVALAASHEFTAVPVPRAENVA